MIQKSSNSPNTFPISINVVLNSRLFQKKKKIKKESDQVASSFASSASFT